MNTKRNNALKNYIKQSIKMNVGVIDRIKAKQSFLNIFSK